MDKTEMTKTEQAIRQQLRDRFATAALNGMLANGTQANFADFAYFAYAYADAMLKERDKNA